MSQGKKKKKFTGEQRLCLSCKLTTKKESKTYFQQDEENKLIVDSCSIDKNVKVKQEEKGNILRKVLYVRNHLCCFLKFEIIS